MSLEESRRCFGYGGAARTAAAGLMSDGVGVVRRPWFLGSGHTGLWLAGVRWIDVRRWIGLGVGDGTGSLKSGISGLISAMGWLVLGLI